MERISNRYPGDDDDDMEGTMSSKTPNLPKKWKQVESELAPGELIIYTEYDSLFITKCRNILISLFETINNSKEADKLEPCKKFVRRILLNYILRKESFVPVHTDIINISYAELERDINKMNSFEREQLEADFGEDSGIGPIAKGIKRIRQRLELEERLRPGGLSKKRLKAVLDSLKPTRKRNDFMKPGNKLSLRPLKSLLPHDWKWIEPELSEGEIIFYTEYHYDFIIKKRKALMDLIMLVNRARNSSLQQYGKVFIRKIILQKVMNSSLPLSKTHSDIVNRSYRRLEKQVQRIDPMQREELERTFGDAQKYEEFVRAGMNFFKILEAEGNLRPGGLSRRRVGLVIETLKKKE